MCWSKGYIWVILFSGMDLRLGWVLPSGSPCCNFYCWISGHVVTSWDSDVIKRLQNAGPYTQAYGTSALIQPGGESHPWKRWGVGLEHTRQLLKTLSRGQVSGKHPSTLGLWVVLEFMGGVTSPPLPVWPLHITSASPKLADSHNWKWSWRLFTQVLLRYLVLPFATQGCSIAVLRITSCFPHSQPPN